MEGVRPPSFPVWADITIMMECTPESGHCRSVCTLCLSPCSKEQDSVLLYSMLIVYRNEGTIESLVFGVFSMNKTGSR